MKICLFIYIGIMFNSYYCGLTILPAIAQFAAVFGEAR